MTTIAVQRIDNTITLCADRRANLADNMKLDSCSKIIQLETGEHIAVAGTLVAMQAFEMYTLENDLDLSSRFSVYRSILNFRQDLSVNQLCLTDKHTDAGDFAVFPLALLIVNNDGVIFSVMNYGEVMEHASYFAQGSGCAYALGALAVGASVDSAMNAAAKFDPATSPHYDIIQIEAPQLADGETTYVDEDEDDEDETEDDATA